MQDDGTRARCRPRRRWRRVAAFARPHRRTIVAFLAPGHASAPCSAWPPRCSPGGPSTPSSTATAPRHRRRPGRRSSPSSPSLDAVVGLLERLESSRLGEGLILDLRRRVFDHVQRMPIAFFTRTHTGALVSRLNNDVIGAQRAFTSALSGVVTNVIALVPDARRDARPVVADHRCWPLVLLPVFVIPARRVGARVGHLEREAAEHNAAMTSQMTERFSAPGRHAGQAVRPPRRGGRPSSAQRAERVRDIGVRSAMAMEVFLRALTLVSGLALALIYGLGGYLALQGQPRRRHGRHAGPAAQPALRPADRAGHRPARRRDRARQLRAGVRGARHRAADRRAPTMPATAARRPGGRRARRRPLRATRRPTRCRWPRSRRSPCSTTAPATRCCTACRSGSSRARRWRSSARRAPASRRSPRSCPASTTSTRARCASAGVDVRDLSFDSIRATVGVVTQDGHLFHDTIRANLRYAAPGRRPTTSCGTRCASARLDDLVALAARRPRHGRRRARLPLLRRRAPAPDDRPPAARRAAGRDPRRGHRPPRLAVGGRRAGGARPRRSTAGPRSSSPTACRRSGPPTRSSSSRTAGSSSGARTPSCSPPAAATPSSTAPSSPTRSPRMRRLTMRSPRRPESTVPAHRG